MKKLIFQLQNTIINYIGKNNREKKKTVLIIDLHKFEKYSKKLCKILQNNLLLLYHLKILRKNTNLNKFVGIFLENLS